MSSRADRSDDSGPLPRPVAAVAFDFDGVFTDNTVIVDQDGRESVVCNRSDGMAIQRLRKAGVHATVLSSEVNPVVAARCRKLGLEHTTGLDDKVAAFSAWLDSLDVDPANAVFVGNDVNDLECMAFAGCGVAVADAFADVHARADLVLETGGGRGAIRELVQMILDALPAAD